MDTVLDDLSDLSNIDAMKIKICLKAQEILKNGSMYDLYTKCINNIPSNENDPNINILKETLNDRRYTVDCITGKTPYQIILRISAINDKYFLKTLYDMFK